MADDLASLLHHVPHYNFKFQAVPSTFDVKDRDYQESLAQIALPVAVLAVFLLLVRFCLACRSTKNDIFSRYRPSEAVCNRFTVYILLLLVIGCAVLCIFGTVQMTHAVNDFTDRTTNTVSLLDSLTASLQDLSDFANTKAVEVSNLTVAAPDESAKKHLSDDLENLSMDVYSAYEKISGALRIDKWNGDIQHYDHIRNIVGIALASLLGAFCVFMVLGLLCRSHGTTACFSVLVVGAFLACWLVGPVLFTASVAVGDFCVDPDTPVSKTIDDPDAAYYIKCTGEFPYQQDFDAANQLLIDAKSSATQLDKYANFTGLLSTIQSDLDSLHARLVCDGGLHQQYEGAVDAVCDDGLKSIFKSAVGLLVAGLCFAITMFLTPKIVESFSEDANYYRRPMVNEVYNERSMLLSAPKGYGTPV
eukprot:m.222646 g.222646  ORF g.222646 m.222646 type:complete len:419 (-) comp16072_c0_seq1:49-1305(-)